MAKKFKKTAIKTEKNEKKFKKVILLSLLTCIHWIATIFLRKSRNDGQNGLPRRLLGLFAIDDGQKIAASSAAMSCSSLK